MALTQQARLEGFAMATVIPLRPATSRTAASSPTILGALRRLAGEWHSRRELRGLSNRLLRDVGVEPAALRSMTSEAEQLRREMRVGLC
jgi:uncharacterized protein YjiS (DUF1127 family)